MATPNFCNYEASKYYAIGSDASDEFIYDDTKKNVYYELENLVKNTNYYTNEIQNFDRSLNRYYGGSYIQSIAIDKSFGDFTTNIVCHVFLSSGRYAGATLDYITEIQFNGYEYGDLEFFNKNFTPSDLEYYSNMPIGMQKIQSKNVQKFVSSALPELHEQIEKIFEMYCEHTLVCTAVFSNGEAIYEIAS